MSLTHHPAALPKQDLLHLLQHCPLVLGNGFGCLYARPHHEQAIRLYQDQVQILTLVSLRSADVEKVLNCVAIQHELLFCLVRGDGGVSQQPAGDLGEAAVPEGALSVHSKTPQRQRGHLPPAAASRGPGHRPSRHLFQRYDHTHTDECVLPV